MTEGKSRHSLTITPTARRQLTEHLPEAGAAAAYEFLVGPLLDNPHRVGKQLRPPLDDRYTNVAQRLKIKSPDYWFLAHPGKVVWRDIYPVSAAGADVPRSRLS